MTKEERSDLRAAWQERITAFRASGQTAAAWCAAQQLKEHQLWYWIRRFRSTTSEQPSPSKFLSVQVCESSASPLLVRVGSVAIEVRPGYDAALLRNLVETLAT